MLFNTQAESQALINLMLLARFSDKKLTISEEETFTAILEKLHWEDVMTPESFVNENITRAREAVRDEVVTEQFINHEVAMFKTAESKSIVLKKLTKLLESDGLDEAEKSLYTRIEKKLK